MTLGGLELKSKKNSQKTEIMNDPKTNINKRRKKDHLLTGVQLHPTPKPGRYQGEFIILPQNYKLSVFSLTERSSYISSYNTWQDV